MSPFADIETKEKKTFQKVTFLDLPPGQHIIRILEENATKVHTHFINRSTVLCLEDDCPICQSNKKIFIENPDNFREVKGYSPKSKRYFVNVLDRTPVKVCPKCQTENKKGVNGIFPPSCSACGTYLNEAEIKPSNKVKLYSFGVGVAEQINAFQQAILDASGEPCPLTSYDIVLIVDGTGKEKKTNLVAQAQRNDPVEVPADAFFDAKNATITLKAEEMLQLQRGVSLKDIFASRKADKADTLTEQVTKETAQDIQEQIEKLFNS